MNKDLPREEQLRIVLQNYDKKVAECSALKEESEKLRKQLRQKDILYKNMLERFSGKNGTTDKFETLYKELLDAHKSLKERVKILQENNEMLKKENAVVLQGKREVVRRMQGIENAISNIFCSVTRFREKFNDGEPLGEIEIPQSKPAAENIPQAYQDFKQSKFYKYVCDVVDTYKKTGSLRGIATKAKEYEVRAMTKEQFFQLGLNNVGEVTNEYVNGIYLQAKKH